MTTAAAKTIEMKPEYLDEFQQIEQDILKETRGFVCENDLLLKDLSDSIITLLDDSINDSLENNAEKAKSIAYVISFICEQKNNFKNLDFFKNENH